MKIPGFVKILAVLLVIALVGGGVFWGIKVAPVMAVLKEKDPDKYETMFSQAKSFDYEKTMQTYKELERMTHEEVLTVRYNSWKKKKQEDPDFLESHWEKEWELREEEKALKREERQEQVNDLVQLSEKVRGSALLIDWEKSGAWEKGLLLREKCVKYLKIEKKENQTGKKIHKLPRIARILSKAGEASLTIPELCEDWVSISHEEGQVTLALEKLKNNMDYFFFVQLLDEIGVPRQDVFSLPSQLDRMTGGFAGS
jgi:hypothetical protein